MVMKKEKKNRIYHRDRIYSTYKLHSLTFAKIDMADFIPSESSTDIVIFTGIEVSPFVGCL